ncbi:hypothetical protein BIY26_16885 [Brenneria goodwinii]|uniref:Uncharacterized protein n=1 Tax=Brenneria goodwinii TaxID=1109412 RepID=A0AAE8JM88_9GAMM|nr:hypothetical protein AWC36_06935 [Brenneria goodwinii]RLM19613.1 hypothetical protein BIY26_16885 [Brenneria goodwinii]
MSHSDLSQIMMKLLNNIIVRKCAMRPGVTFILSYLAQSASEVLFSISAVMMKKVKDIDRQTNGK